MSLLCRPYAPLFVLPLLILAVWALNLQPRWDDVVSGHFYEAAKSVTDPLARWSLPKSDEALNWRLHKLPRHAFTAIGIAALLTWLASYRVPALLSRRRIAALLTLAIILVPSAVALLKEYSGHYCPNRLVRYGGLAPDDYATLPVIPAYASKADCYPAAHPAAGWALLILGVAATTRRGRVLGYAAGVACGAGLSLVQIARGEHFLSHCLATALIAWWFAWALTRAWDAKRPIAH
jgi:membrane-associated PAP2 superfamily phosphatase